MTNISLFFISYIIMTFIMISMVIKFMHPTIIIMMMLLYSILLSANLSSWKISFIYSMLFLLVMISGLLIIFLYFSSLISNEKSTKYPTSWSILMLFTILLILLILLELLNTYQPYYYGVPSSNINPLFYLEQSTDKPLSLMYTNKPPTYLTLISMIYLLISLISTIKIITPKIKSMRKIM